MKINFSWKHVDRSEAAEKYAVEKMDRVSKYLHHIEACDLSFEKIHGEVHANAKLHADASYFNAQNTAKDIYPCIDGLEDKLISQVSKHHDKKHTH